MLNILVVGIGGFIGAILRYLMSGWAQNLVSQAGFPYGTLSVNIIGCLVVGLLGGLADNHGVFSPQTRLFLLIGVLGSFTTYSTFGYETMVLMRDRQLLAVFGNIALHLGAGLTAVWAGYTMSLLR